MVDKAATVFPRNLPPQRLPQSRLKRVKMNTASLIKRHSGLALFSGLNVTPARTIVWIETAEDVPGGIVARTSEA
jgi:hypothetical protein